MKKLLLLFVAVVTASCSPNESSPVITVNQETALSVLDGNLLSFKDDASFINEYSKLSELKSNEEIQKWISKKGFKSLLNTSNDSIDIQNDVLNTNRIIYSDAFKSILNSESKFKINGNVIWANEQNLYLLNENNSNLNKQKLVNIKNELRIYGKILNKSSSSKASSSARLVFPNENRAKQWSVTYNSAQRNRRIVLTLFNETIVLNGETASSKMFISCIKQGEFCSFWRCRWNQEFEPIELALSSASAGGWIMNPNLYFYNNITFISANTSTILFATASIEGPSIPSNFDGGAMAWVTTLNGSSQFPYTWSQQISWF